MNYRKVRIQTRKTISEGNLSFFEEVDTTFQMKRFYYIYDVPAKTWRGGHAHKKLKQLLFCPYGSIRIELDDGRERRVEVLDHPEEGLLLEPGIWRDMYWNIDNSVLCVAASEEYDESDYIRDYHVFLEWKKENRGDTHQDEDTIC